MFEWNENVHRAPLFPAPVVAPFDCSKTLADTNHALRLDPNKMFDLSIGADKVI